MIAQLLLPIQSVVALARVEEQIQIGLRHTGQDKLHRVPARARCRRHLRVGHRRECVAQRLSRVPDGGVSRVRGSNLDELGLVARTNSELSAHVLTPRRRGVHEPKHMRPLAAVLRAGCRMLRRRRAHPVQQAQCLPQLDALVARQKRRHLSIDPFVGRPKILRRLPDVLLRNHHDSAGERVPVQIAPHRHHAFVLRAVAHAVELVQHREQMTPRVCVRIAPARRDADADHEVAPPEAHARKMPRQIHHHPAAGAAPQTEHDAHHRLRSRRVDARGEAAQRPLQFS